MDPSYLEIGVLSKILLREQSQILFEESVWGIHRILMTSIGDKWESLFHWGASEVNCYPIGFQALNNLLGDLEELDGFHGDW